MTGRLPRDRWVGASPGLNVTPGGKALEALDKILALARRNDLVLREQIEEIVAAVNLDEAACLGRVEPLAVPGRLAD